MVDSKQAFLTVKIHENWQTGGDEEDEDANEEAKDEEFAPP